MIPMYSHLIGRKIRVLGTPTVEKAVDGPVLGHSPGGANQNDHFGSELTTVA